MKILVREHIRSDLAEYMWEHGILNKDEAMEVAETGEITSRQLAEIENWLRPAERRYFEALLKPAGFPAF